MRAERTSVYTPAKHRLLPLPIGDAATAPDLVALSVLGEGGMGIVHLAEQRSLRRNVAVKTLRTAAESPEVVDNFVREAWVTGWLSHPNIPSVHALGVDAQGRPALVMEEIRGETWERLLASRTHSGGLSSALDEDLVVFEQVCHAVEYAHSRGVIHRDLKPANVMIGPFGEVLVLDWGLAVAVSDEASTRILRASEATGVSGSPAYMAPEMARGEAARLSVRTDVYLLGAMLYEVALGIPPHLGGSVLDTLRRAALGSLPAFPEDMPSELRRILERALAAAPEDRFASVAELRLAVADYRIHRETRTLLVEAERHVEELGAGTLTEAADHFQKARFAYGLVARTLGSDRGLRDGLASATCAMAARYVDSGDANAALALLDEAGHEAPELRAKAHELLSKKAALDFELLELREVAKSVDVASGVGTRVRAFVLVALLWGVPMLVVGRLVHAGLLELHYRARYVLLGVSIAAIAVAVFVERRAILPNPINRRILYFAMTIGVTVISNAAICQALAVPFESSLILEMFLTQFILTILGIFVRRELVAAAFVHVPFLVAGIALRSHALELLGVAVIAANLTMAAAERRLEHG